MHVNDFWVRTRSLLGQNGKELYKEEAGGGEVGKYSVRKEKRGERRQSCQSFSS